MQELQVVSLIPKDLPSVLSLEADVMTSLERPDQLRRNTPFMWNQCLGSPHYAVGVIIGNALAAVAVLYVPQDGDGEDLSHLIGGIYENIVPSANYKICMVHPQYRGQGWQCMLGQMLEAEAVQRGIRLLCSTVSPHNEASIRNLEKIGYCYHSTLSKYGFTRHLYFKMLS